MSRGGLSYLNFDIMMLLGHRYPLYCNKALFVETCYKFDKNKLKVGCLTSQWVNWSYPGWL